MSLLLNNFLKPNSFRHLDVLAESLTECDCIRMQRDIVKGIFGKASALMVVLFIEDSADFHFEVYLI